MINCKKFITLALALTATATPAHAMQDGCDRERETLELLKPLAKPYENIAVEDIKDIEKLERFVAVHEQIQTANELLLDCLIQFRFELLRQQQNYRKSADN